MWNTNSQEFYLLVHIQLEFVIFVWIFLIEFASQILQQSTCMDKLWMCLYSFFLIFKYYFLDEFLRFHRRNGLNWIFSQPRIRVPGTYSALSWVSGRNFLYRALCSVYWSATGYGYIDQLLSMGQRNRLRPGSRLHDPQGEDERLFLLSILCVTVP